MKGFSLRAAASWQDRTAAAPVSMEFIDVKEQYRRESNTHVYAIYTIRSRYRDRMVEALAAAGIPVAVYYPKCLHTQPVFAGLGYREGDFPEAERASGEVLSLPMHPFLESGDQDRVIEAVADAVRRCA